MEASRNCKAWSCHVIVSHGSPDRVHLSDWICLPERVLRSYQPPLRQQSVAHPKGEYRIPPAASVEEFGITTALRLRSLPARADPGLLNALFQPMRDSTWRCAAFEPETRRPADPSSCRDCDRLRQRCRRPEVAITALGETGKCGLHPPDLELTKLATAAIRLRGGSCCRNSW